MTNQLLIFHRNFLDIRFNMVEKKSIIKLTAKELSYASVVLGDYKVTFLWEGKDAAFSLSLYCI